MPATDLAPADQLREAERLMTICNACRYCEGFCAVFPAMELRRDFPAGDLDYLANLCHELRRLLSTTASTRRRTNSPSTCRSRLRGRAR